MSSVGLAFARRVLEAAIFGDQRKEDLIPPVYALLSVKLEGKQTGDHAKQETKKRD